MSFASNSVVAKSRAVFGRRLRQEDYAALAAKENVAGVCDGLKMLPRYASALSAVNSRSVHRGQLEVLLGRAIFDIYDSFRRFDYTDSRGYFDFIVERLEIEQIILLIGAVYAGGNDEYIAAVPVYLDKRSKADLTELGEAENLSQLAVLLEDTPYAKALREPLLNAAAGGTLDIRECERRIYTEYYLELFAAVEKKFRGAERKELKRVILRTIDMENVTSLYRSACFAKMPRESAKKNLLPFRYRLSDDVIDELVAEKDLAKVAARLERIGYHSAEGENSTVEMLTERISQNFLEKTIRTSSHAAVVYFALTECLAAELKNLRTVTEGVRYGMNSGEIMKMLVI